MIFWCGPFFKALWNLLQHHFSSMFWIFGCKACGVLVPWPGIEPVSPALQGGFLTTGPPGKSLCAGSCNSDVTTNVSHPQAMDSTGASPRRTAKLGTRRWRAEPSWVMLCTLWILYHVHIQRLLIWSRSISFGRPLWKVTFPIYFLLWCSNSPLWSV